MNGLSAFFHRFSNWKSMTVLVLLLIVVVIIPNYTKAAPISLVKFDDMTNGVKLLDGTMFYTPDEAYKMIESYGAEGREYYLYRILLPLDCLIPMVYSLLFAVTMTMIYRRTRFDRYLGKLLIIPLAAGVSDYLENVFEFILLYNFPKRLDMVARISSAFSICKGAFILLTVISIVVGIVLIFRRKNDD